MPYPGESEPVQGFVMNFSTGEIIDSFIPLRKVEYCTEFLVYTYIQEIVDNVLLLQLMEDYYVIIVENVLFPNV